MSEISKAYEPQSVEDKWYQFWLDGKFFVADAKSPKPAYSIVIPPPNVTGVLHIGHVLNSTIQDILARRARMEGKEVLWLPGTDHAGISTQNAVEKTLRKSGEMRQRDDFGREKLVEKIWEWKEKHGGIIIQQLKKLGASCDWTRERFTMDPEYSRCVQRVFVDLYKKGVIYRGKRMVNWCPASLTALSDEEVVMKEQKGFLYYFKVEVVGSVAAPAASVDASSTETPNVKREARSTAPEAGALPEEKIFLTIATTRPETIPGDTAVAVNPKDPRYAHLIGKHVVRPLPAELPREQKLIPIIGDEHVDFEFGTGVLKVTPAHDKADFEIGARHKLAQIEVIAANGQMNDAAGVDLRGLDRFKARKVTVEKLTELGALEKEEPYTNNVGYSERADVPIEPRLSEQWFLKYPSVEKARNCVEQSEFFGKIIPVVSISGHELAGHDRAELRESAIKLAQEQGWLGHAFKNENTGWEIYIRRKSLSHAFNNRSTEAILAVAAIPELLRHAILIRSEPHQPPNPRFKQVHYFAAALSIGGELHRMQLTVKELADGRMLYDHKAKKITPGGKPLVAHLPKEKLGIQPAPGAGLKVRDLLADVNAQKMQFHPQRWAKVYDHWMGGLQDWCVSRQLWWGHRIPVWYNTEIRAKLFTKIPVIELSGHELAGANIKQLRDAAWEFADRHELLNHSFPNAETGWKIVVRTASLEHAFTHQGAANIKATVALPELIRTAVKVGSLHHLPPNEHFKAVHLFVAAARIAGDLYQVKITVKEHLDGQKLYDHQLFKRNTPDGKSPTPVALASEPARPTSSAEILIADLFVNVNTDTAFTRCQLEEPGPGWVQDPDVLDTWFSSWLWPFATMGWPEQTGTLKKFYPTTDLVTGPDIIFFWVARMIMAGYEYMGGLPFQNVYFTGIIRDKQGRKMSKSLGNSPDPLDLIAKFGADALRFGVMRAAPLGQDILFDEQNVELGRNFCNKLWNACRFRQMVGTKDEGRMMNDETGASTGTSSFNLHPSTFPMQGEIEPTLLTSDDKWILLKLDAAIREVTIALNEYKFSDATAALYRFFWSEYCDWYVEASKAVFFGEDAARKANTLAVIDFVLSHTLRLFHPFLPFITEELWHGMGYSTDMPENQGGKTIMFAPWPLPLDDDFKGHYGLDDCYLHIAGAKYELVSQGRNLRREANISAAKKIKFVLKPVNFLPPHDIEVIRLLLNAEAVEVSENYSPAKGTLTARTELGELFLPLEGLRSEEELAAEKARLTKELEKIEAEISKVGQKLANPNFTEKVPVTVLQEHQQRLAEWQNKREQVETALAALQG